MKGLNDMEKAFIEEKAYELLKQGSFSDDGAVDVVQLAKNLGFAVLNVQSKAVTDDLDGFLLINEDDNNILDTKSNRVIGVNVNREFDVKRFIIAHELGHFKLKYAGERIFAMRDSKHGRSEEENEIDFFAACLLMPRNGFIKSYEDAKNEAPENVIKRLACEFKVPEKGVLRRLQELDLVELK